MVGRSWPLAAFVLFVLPAIGPVSTEAQAAGLPDVTYERYQVTVDGEVAKGYLAYPTGSTPTTLLVIAHGCCNKLNPAGWSEAQAFGNSTSRSWNIDDTARAYGVAVVGMDFRGPGYFDVWKGHLDTIAATEDLQGRWPIERTILYGGSMGGTVSGLAVAARPDLYDAWINLYGAVNLFEIFATFGFMPGIVPAVDPDDPTAADTTNPTGSWMVAEMGGLPATVPEEWIKRSPAFQAHRMVGLPRAYHCYGVGDAYVPISQALEMQAALTAAGVPSSLYINVVERGGIQGPMRPGVTGQNPSTTWGEPPLEYPGPNGYGGTGTARNDPLWIGPAAHDSRSHPPCPAIVAGLLDGAPVDDGPSFIQYNAGPYHDEVAQAVEDSDPSGLVPDGTVPQDDVAVPIPDDVRVLSGCVLQALQSVAIEQCVPGA